MPSSFARHITLGAIVVVASACGGSPVAPSQGTGPPLNQIGESATYVFRASAGDTIDTAWQERYHAWLADTLGAAPGRRITYNKYTSRTHMQAVMGVGNTNADADRATFSIHTLWPTDNHEVVHLFTSSWGDPVALVNEGMAVAFQIDPARDQTPRWSGTPLHDLVRQFRQQGRFRPLADLVETASFRNGDANVSYPESGSFMRWLIDRYGLERVRALYARAAGPSESAAGVRASFAAVCGVSLDELEAAWLAFIG